MDVIALIKQERAPGMRHVDDLIQRIKAQKLPTGAPKRSSTEAVRSAITERTMAAPDDEEACQSLLKAIRTMQPTEVDPDYIFPIMLHCYERFTSTQIATAIQYAAAHLDVILHRQLTAAAVSPPPQAGIE